jgi:hypothetical protein
MLLPSPSDYKHVTVVIEIERRVDKDRLLIGFSKLIVNYFQTKAATLI